MLAVILALGAGGLLWKGGAPDHPDPESPNVSRDSLELEPISESDAGPYEGLHYDANWPLTPMERLDGILDNDDRYIDY